MRTVFLLLSCLLLRFCFAHLEYCYPLPDAKNVSVQSHILVRPPASIAPELLQIELVGNESGVHAGTQSISGNTVIFSPDAFFLPGERVHVKVKSPDQTVLSEYTFQTGAFESVTPFKGTQAVEPETAAPIRLINNVAVPSDFPEFRPEIINGTPDDACLFLTNSMHPGYCMILENDGTPRFYLKSSGAVQDFKMQPNGYLTYFQYAGGRHFCALDSNFNQCKTFQSDFGYTTDEHDLLWLENGHYVLIGFTHVNYNLAPWIFDGQPDAKIEVCCIQEFDQNDKVVFQWRSNDFIDFSQAPHIDFTQNTIDYVHINSVAVDYDGHFIISCRHISQVLKIDRHTGKIIWRLGGVQSDFVFSDELPFSFQHDARPVPGKPDHYTILDNGNYHQPPFSRAVEYAVDINRMTAEKVWEYRLPAGHTLWMGNVQRLPNGNTLVNWADRSLPKVTQVTPQGDVVYQGDFVIKDNCYRAFRFPCNYQADKPSLFVEPLGRDIALIFNKFGDPDVEKYIVYAGLDSNRLSPVAAVSQNYTYYQCTENTAWYYFRVSAVNKNGKERYSDIEKVYIHYTPPNENMLDNGDFTQGVGSWKLWLADSVSADHFVNENGEMVVDVKKCGTLDWHITLLLENVPLVQGNQYRFEFDAHSTDDKIIVAKIERDRSPFENYGKIGMTSVNKRQKHYRYDFVMQEPTNLHARIVFTCGLDTNNLYLDNVSLVHVDHNAAVQQRDVPKNFITLSNYPNPFNAGTTIEIELPQSGFLKADIYDILGRHVRQLIDTELASGVQLLHWNGDNEMGKSCSSGLYFCTIRFNGGVQIRKLLLTK